MRNCFAVCGPDMIHDEWIRNLLKERPDISAANLEKTRELMNWHVPGSVVVGFEPLIKAIQLPDEDDRYVVAAVIRTRAEAIITFNLRDFPASAVVIQT